MPCRCGDDREVLDTVAVAPAVLAPIHLGGIGREIGAADMVVSADLRAAQPAKEALGLVGASLAVAVRDGVINPPG